MRDKQNKHTKIKNKKKRKCAKICKFVITINKNILYEKKIKINKIKDLNNLIICLQNVN